MSGTQAVAAREALLDGIAALPAFEAVDVALAFDTASDARERVYTRRPKFTQEPASLRSGRTHRNEQGSFQAVVRVEGVGVDQSTTSARAVALGVLLEEWVADNRSTIAGLDWLVAKGDGELVELANDLGTLAILTYTLAYSARLT